MILGPSLRLERDLGLLGDGRVGAVDDARRRGLGLHGRERRAHVERRDDLRLDLGPEAEPSQPLLGVDAGGHGGRDRRCAICGRSTRSCGVLTTAVDVRRHDDDQDVRQEIHAVGRSDQARLLDGVHPGRVGREEDVGGSAGLDLPREVVGAGEGELDLRRRRRPRTCGPAPAATPSDSRRRRRAAPPVSGTRRERERSERRRVMSASIFLSTDHHHLRGLDERERGRRRP